MKTNLKSIYDDLFIHNIENNIKNIIIYGDNDTWEIDQNYKNLDPEEHIIWKNLFDKVYPLAYKYGTKIFKEGIDKLTTFNKNISNCIPNINCISNQLYDCSSWRIKTVAGFVDEIIFFELLKDRQFPSSDIIRLSKRFHEKYKNSYVRNDLSYTPEPDIFHEIFGHAPFLFNNKYCDLLQDIGCLGCDIIFKKDMTEDLKSHNLKRLQNFVWWTLEFGILESSNDLGVEIYGAGILSSYSEIENVVNCINNDIKIIDYDIESVVMTRFDYSELQDRYFLINSFDSLISSYYSNKDIFLFKG